MKKKRNDRMPMFVVKDDDYDPEEAGKKATEKLGTMPAAAELTDRLHVPDSMPMFGKPSNDPRHGKVAQFTGQHDNIRTERATQHDDSVKRILLNNAKIHKFANEMLNAEPDDRPLIDKLHEATFFDTVGMQWFKDKYALRMLLRKAHCFTLDKTTSALVADFSVAIAKDLESARRMAIPPFPTTWIEIDNVARLNRIKEMGIPLTKTAAGETEAGAPVPRVGWLITPGAEGGYNATYVVQLDSGMASAPLSYWWHSEEPSARPDRDEEDKIITRLCFGVLESNVGTTDALPVTTPLHGFDIKHGTSMDVLEMMGELSGELRHIWGFLIALGAGQLGVDAKYSAQPKPQCAPPVMKNGKPLIPIEHKVLHLHLAKRTTPDKVVVRMITHHKLKWHEVRAHFRTYKNKDGSVRMRIPIPAHERGDEKLGRVEKTYKVER